MLHNLIKLIRREFHYILCLLVFVMAGTLGLILFGEPALQSGDHLIADDDEMQMYSGNEPLTFSDVREPNGSRHFTSYDDATITMPGFDHARCWIRIPLENRTDQARNFTIEVKSRSIDLADLYVPSRDGTFSHFKHGECRSPKERQENSWISAFPVHFEPGEKKTCYLFLLDRFRVDPGIRIWNSRRDFDRYKQKEERTAYVYFGLLIGLFVTNLCVYLAFGYNDLRCYLLYLSSAGCLQAVNFNMHFLFLYNIFLPIHVYLPFGINDFIIRAMFVITAATLILFANAFLGIASFAPRLDRMLDSVATVMLVAAPFVLVEPLINIGRFSVVIVILTWVSSSFLAFVAGLLAAVHRVRQARYFIPAFVLLMIVSWKFVIVILGGRNTDSSIMLQWLYASGLEMIILTFGLVDRFLFVNQQRLEAQEKVMLEARQRAQIQEQYATELEHTVKNRTQDLQQANDQKDRVLRIVGHDLRVPIDSIAAMSELIRRSPAKLSRSDMVGYADDVGRGTRYLRDVIDSLLCWAGIGSATASMKMDLYLVNDLIDAAFEPLRLRAEEKAIRVDFDVPDQTFVVCDYTGIATVLRNIINNALKFSSRGDDVQVCVSIVENTAEFRVVDTGPGMSTDRIADIEEGWSTLSTVGTDGEPGSGIGLQICRDVLDQHDSSLTIASTEGEGTAMSFRLPVNIPEPTIVCNTTERRTICDQDDSVRSPCGITNEHQ